MRKKHANESMHLQHAGPIVTVNTPLLYKEERELPFWRRVPWALILLSIAVIVCNASEQILRKIIATK